MSPFFSSSHMNTSAQLEAVSATSSGWNCPKWLATSIATFSDLRDNVLPLTPRHFIDKSISPVHVFDKKRRLPWGHASRKALWRSVSQPKTPGLRNESGSVANRCLLSSFLFPITWSRRHSGKQCCKHSDFFVARSDDFNCRKTNLATFSDLRENILAVTPRRFIDEAMWKQVRLFWKVKYCDCKIQSRRLSGDIWSPSGDLASSTHKCRGVYKQ